MPGAADNFSYKQVCSKFNWFDLHNRNYSFRILYYSALLNYAALHAYKDNKPFDIGR